MYYTTVWWLRLRRVLCLRKHATTARQKSAFGDIFDPIVIVILTLDLLTTKSDTFVHAPKSVSGDSLVKFR